MTFLQRISKLIAANINHLLDQAEDPEVMIKQIIREMEEGIIELRRETAKALAGEKLLQKKIEAAKGTIKDLEEKALQVLAKGNEELARKILLKKSGIEEELIILKEDVKNAGKNAQIMKDELSNLEDKVQIARRKKEELIRRMRVVDAREKTQNLKQKTGQALDNFDRTLTQAADREGMLATYEQKIVEMEAEAQAYDDLSSSEEEDENNLEKQEKQQHIEDELQRLKKKLKKK